MSSWWLKVSKRSQVFKRLHNPADILLFLEILGFAAVVPLLLRFKLTRLQALLKPEDTCPTADPAMVFKIVSYVNAALQIGRPLVRTGCLTKGITLYHFLRKAGLDVDLCFGMGILDDRFVGHCWLVKDGEPFVEKMDPRPLFTQMYSFDEQH